jgi:hypothetical protein
VGLLTSAFFLWLTFRGEDLGEIWCQFMSGDPYWLMLAGAIATSGGLIRALRWRLLLSPLKVETSLHSRWAALNIGFMVTNVYPGRLGEIVRPLALSRMAPVTMSGALGTVVLERVLDTVALVLLRLISLLAPTFPSDATVLGRPIGIAVIAAVVLAVTILVLMVCIIVWPSRLTVVAVGLARRLPGHLDDGLRSSSHSCPAYSSCAAPQPWFRPWRGRSSSGCGWPVRSGLASGRSASNWVLWPHCSRSVRCRSSSRFRRRPAFWERCRQASR